MAVSSNSSAPLEVSHARSCLRRQGCHGPPCTSASTLSNGAVTCTRLNHCGRRVGAARGTSASTIVDELSLPSHWARRVPRSASQTLAVHHSAPSPCGTILPPQRRLSWLLCWKPGGRCWMKPKPRPWWGSALAFRLPWRPRPGVSCTRRQSRSGIPTLSSRPWGASGMRRSWWRTTPWPPRSASGQAMKRRLSTSRSALASDAELWLMAPFSVVHAEQRGALAIFESRPMVRSAVAGAMVAWPLSARAWRYPNISPEGDAGRLTIYAMLRKGATPKSCRPCTRRRPFSAAP